MQAAEPLLENVIPDPVRTVGQVAGLEARIDGRDELCIKDCPIAERACQPRVKARARDLKNPAQPTDQPDMAVLRPSRPICDANRLPGNG